MTKALRTAQGRSNFPRQKRAQLRAHIAPHIHCSPLGGHRNQGLFVGAGFYANPFAPEFRALQLACIFQLDDQPGPLQRNTFAVCGMARIHQKCHPYRHQLQPGKRKDKPSALKPKKQANPERHSTQRGVHPSQLRRCDRAIAPQKPVDALAGDGGETKNWVRHG